jgi:hypothetical protein
MMMMDEQIEKEKEDERKDIGLTRKFQNHIISISGFHLDSSAI